MIKAVTGFNITRKLNTTFPEQNNLSRTLFALISLAEKILSLCKLMTVKYCSVFSTDFRFERSLININRVINKLKLNDFDSTCLYKYKLAYRFKSVFRLVFAFNFCLSGFKSKYQLIKAITAFGITRKLNTTSPKQYHFIQNTVFALISLAKSLFEFL